MLTQCVAYALEALSPPGPCTELHALWRELTRDDVGSLTTAHVARLAVEFGFDRPQTLVGWFVDHAVHACAWTASSWSCAEGCPICRHDEALVTELGLEAVEEVLSAMRVGRLAPACDRHDRALRTRVGLAG